MAVVHAVSPLNNLEVSVTCCSKLTSDEDSPCWNDTGMAAATAADSEDVRRSSRRLATPADLFWRGGSPSGALRSLLAMCWLWPSGSERRDVFLGSALLSLGRLLKDKLAGAAAHADDCLQVLCCQDDDKAAVTMGSAPSADAVTVFHAVVEKATLWFLFYIGKKKKK